MARYMISSPLKIGFFHTIVSIFSPRKRHRIIDSSPTTNVWKPPSLVTLLSKLIMRLLDYVALPMSIFGGCTEYVLNLLRLNGGILHTLVNVITGRVIVPRCGTEKYYSAVGLLDYRFDLYEEVNEEMISTYHGEAGNRFYADLCVMASKIAYENALVIKHAVTKHWKMHFLDFFDFWNAKLERKATQAFMFADREEDARFVVIAFRGTEPFDSDDWKTDVDFSYFEWEGVGKIHLGFLEALGLAKRKQPGDWDCLLEALGFSNNQSTLSSKNQTQLYVSPLLHARNSYSSGPGPLDLDEKHSNPQKPLAFYVLIDKLIQFLETHKNAKFIVTGHSLGAALATLFVGVICGCKDEDLKNRKSMLIERLFAVYTFGQPRVGDVKFAKFMNETLNKPFVRYFRVVYSNDIVPTVPFDDEMFNYKHFGVGLHYNCFYREKNMEEEPREGYAPNFWVEKLKYFIPERVTAAIELVGGVFRHRFEGDAYEECSLSILCRMFGLVLPGVCAHNPSNYVNSVRLGPSVLPLPTPTTP